MKMQIFKKYMLKSEIKMFQMQMDQEYMKNYFYLKKLLNRLINFLEEFQNEEFEEFVLINNSLNTMIFF